MALFVAFLILPLLVPKNPGTARWLGPPMLGAWFLVGRSVVRTWNAADAKVLRWSAVGLLCWCGLILYGVLSVL